MKNNEPKTKKCSLHDVRLIMETDGFASGLEIKRPATIKETLYVLGNILGVDLNFVKNEMTPEEKREYNQSVTGAFNDFIKGDIDFYAFSNTLEVYFEETFYWGVFIDILGYLCKRGIV